MRPLSRKREDGELNVKLTRRTFLRATGVSLALPWLDALAPAQQAATPRRMVCVCTPLGLHAQNLFPQAVGRDYALTPYLDVLREARNDFTVMSGLAHPEVGPSHDSIYSFLTAAPHPEIRAGFRNSVSLDQVLAEQVGSATRFPSLALMVGAEEMSISYTRSGAMIPPLRSPVQLYERLFIADSPAARVAAHARISADRSLLDSLRERTKELERTVGAGDRRELDQYFSAIRDLERDLAGADGWVDRAKPDPGQPKPEDMRDTQRLITQTRSMLALVRLALASDSTRVVTVACNSGSVTPREIPGVNSMIHEITHHGGRPAVLAELARVEAAQFTELAGFLDGLRATAQGGRTLLDQTAVLYGTNMGSANSHANDNLPVLLAGGGFKHAGHLAFDRAHNYPLTNLYVALLQRMGVATETFSSGKGTMQGLEMG